MAGSRRRRPPAAGLGHESRLTGTGRAGVADAELGTATCPRREADARDRADVGVGRRRQHSSRHLGFQRPANSMRSIITCSGGCDEPDLNVRASGPQPGSLAVGAILVEARALSQPGRTGRSIIFSTTACRMRLVRAAVLNTLLRRRDLVHQPKLSLSDAGGGAGYPPATSPADRKPLDTLTEHRQRLVGRTRR